MYSTFLQPRSWFSGLQDAVTQEHKSDEEPVKERFLQHPPGAPASVTPTNSFDFKAIASKVETLEHDLSKQIKSNEGVLKVLRVISRVAKQMGKSVSDVVADKEYLKSLKETSLDEVRVHRSVVTSL